MPGKHRPQFTLNPLLWISISFALGIVAASLWQLPLELLIAIAVVFSVAAVLIRKSAIASVFLLAAFFLAGEACYYIEISSASPDRLSRMYDEGRLISGDPITI